jgi:hypothetical protein
MYCIRPSNSCQVSKYPILKLTVLLTTAGNQYEVNGTRDQAPYLGRMGARLSLWRKSACQFGYTQRLKNPCRHRRDHHHGTSARLPWLRG